MLVDRGRFLNRFKLHRAYQLLIPDAHVDITVEVTRRHLVLQRSLTLRRKHNHVEEVRKFAEAGITLTHGFHLSNVSRVHARVLGDEDGTLDYIALLLPVLRLILQTLLLCLRELRLVVLAQANIVLYPIVVLDLDKDFVFLKQTLLIGDTDHDTGISQLDAGLVLESKGLAKDHVAHNLIEEGLLKQ